MSQIDINSVTLNSIEFKIPGRFRPFVLKVNSVFISNENNLFRIRKAQLYLTKNILCELNEDKWILFHPQAINGMRFKIF